MKAFGIEIKTLFNEPRTRAQADYVARIETRAVKLFFESGYRKENDDSITTCDVVTPGGIIYTVTYPNAGNDFKGDCNCEGFQRDGECKHRLAVLLMRELEKAADAANCTDVADYLLLLEIEANAPVHDALDALIAESDLIDRELRHNFGIG
jgi:hypothetical protein